MSVTDTRVRISLLDDASGPIQNLTRNYESLNGAVGRGTSSLSGLHGSMNSGAIDRYTGSIQKADEMINHLAYSVAHYTVIYKGLSALGNLFDKTVGASYEYGKMYESNSIGIAGILASMTKVNGKQLEWNQALGVSTTVMKNLQAEALRTAATSGDLIETFRAILGPGLAGGMNIDQITKLTTVGVNAVKSLGLPHNQLIQELRDLVQGGIRPSSSTLATALGITDADIKAAKQSSEGLFKFLMDRMTGFEKSVQATSDTVAGRIARIEEAISVAGATGGAGVYQMWSDALGYVADRLIVVDEKTKQMKISPEFQDAIMKVSDTVQVTAKDLKDIGAFLGTELKPLGKEAVDALGFAVTHTKEILMLIAAYKGASILRDVISIRNHTKDGYVAQTLFGKAVQDTREFIYGEAEAVREVALAQQKLNELAALHQSSLAASNGNLAVLRGNGNGILNIAQNYEKMGLSAEFARYQQAKVLEALLTQGQAAADKQKELADRIAISTQRYSELARLTKQAGQGMLAAPGVVHDAINGDIAAYNNVKNGARTEQSVTRLEVLYKRLGVSASEAYAMQQRVQRLVLDGHTKEAEALMREQEAYARGVSAKIAGEAAVRTVYSERLKLIKQLDTAFSMSNSEKNVLNYITGTSATSAQAAEVERLVNLLKQAGLAQRDAYTLVAQYTNALKKGHMDAAEAIALEIENTAKLIAVERERTIVGATLIKTAREWRSLDYSALTSEQEKLLAFDSERILKLSTQKAEVEKVRSAYTVLNNAVKEGMLTQEESHKAVIALQKQVATGYVDIAARISDEIIRQHEAGTLAGENANRIVEAQAKEMAQRRQILSMTGEQITRNQRLMLENDALNVARLTGDAKVIKMVRDIIANEVKLEESIVKRGQSAVEANNAYIETLKQVVTSQEQVNKSQLESFESLQRETAAKNKNALATHNMVGKLASLAIATGIVAGTIGDMTDETDGWIGSIGKWTINIAFFVEALKTIKDALKDIETQAYLTRAALLAATGFKIAAIGGLVGGAVAYGYGKSHGLSDQDMLDRYFKNPNAKKGWESIADENDSYRADWTKSALAAQQAGVISGVDPNKLTNAFDQLTDSAKKAAEAQEKQNRTLVDGMRAQEGLTPYKLYDTAGRYIGTGCMYAISNALKAAGVPGGLIENGGAFRVDTFAQNAQKLGLLHANDGSYTARPGDVAIYSNRSQWDHAAMLTDNYGTIQNGAGGGPNGGVYESASRPESMGNVTHWVSTSMFNDKKNAEAFTAMTEFQRKYTEMYGSAQGMISDIIKASKDATGDTTAYEKVMAEAQAKADSFRQKMAKASAFGVDTKEVQKAIDKYMDVMHKKAVEAQQDEEAKKLNLRIEAAGRIKELGKGTLQDQNKALDSQLEAYRNYLKEVLADTSLNYERRAEYERKLADTIKKINEQSAYSTRRAWSAAYEDITSRQINYKDSILNVYGDIQNAGVALISSTTADGDRLATFFSSITSSILENMAKIIIQGLITNAILSIFGMGSRGISGFASSNLSNLSGINTGFGYAGKSYSFGTSLTSGASLPHFASGGDFSPGVAILGEEGPELVHFGTTGHVYNNDETRQMLKGGNNGTANVKIELINQTGTQIKAEQSGGLKWNGTEYVETIVLKMVATDKYGIRTMMQTKKG